MRVLKVAIVLVFAGLALQMAAVAQQPQRGWIGVAVETVVAGKMPGIPSGALVTEIARESPAANKLRTGDVIIFLNGQPVQNAEALASAIEALAPGSKAQLSAVREKQFLSLEIAIASPPAPVIAAGAYPAVGDPLLRLDTGGHQAIIRNLTFTPDGKFIVAAGEDKLIRVWDWQTRRVVRTIRGQSGVGPEGKIYAMALSPDGRWLAVGGWMKIRGEAGHQIRLYDFASSELKALLKGHSDVVASLAFSPGGKHLISGSSDNDAILWDVEEARLLYRLKGHRAHIYAVGFTPDGARAVTGSYDNTLRLWNVADGALLKEMTGHGDKVHALAVSAKDGSIASGDNDGEIRLWDGSTGAFLKVLAKQGGWVGSLSFSPDDRILLSTCGGGPPCSAEPQIIWDTRTGTKRLEVKKHDNIVLASALSPDGRLFR